MAEMKIQRGLPLQRAPENADAKLREAAKMYEQHFLNEMFKSMRKTVDRSDLNQASMTENIFSEKLDNEYVQTWANQGGVGLADIIYDQLQERFFGGNQKGMHPLGPMKIQKGTTLKIDEGKPAGIPTITPKSSLPQNEVSFLYEWKESEKPLNRDVNSPFDGEVVQNFRIGDDRQMLKLAHDNGLVSTISYIGQANNFSLGDTVSAGQKLGNLSPYSLGMTWHLAHEGA